MSIKINIIAAVSQNGIIGKDGTLPWRLSDDMRSFRELTTGSCVVMGRRTYESIGKPLTNRKNAVLTSSKSFEAPGCEVLGSIEDAVEWAQREEGGLGGDLFVIGGRRAYAEALPLAHRIYLTEVLSYVDGDTTFPPWDRSQWSVSSAVYVNKNENNTHSYVMSVLDRRGHI